MSRETMKEYADRGGVMGIGGNSERDMDTISDPPEDHAIWAAQSEAHWDRRAGVYRHNGAVSADGDWWYWGTVGGRPATIPGALRLSGGPRNGVVVA